MSEPREITKDQYYQLVGLLAAATRQIDLLKAMERAAVAITGELDNDGAPSPCGHTTDILWGSRELDDGLRIMKITVTP